MAYTTTYGFFTSVVHFRISNTEDLKKAITDKLATVDLNVKKRDFEHLLFNTHSADKILMFPEFVENQL